MDTKFMRGDFVQGLARPAAMGTYLFVERLKVLSHLSTEVRTMVETYELIDAQGAIFYGKSDKLTLLSEPTVTAHEARRVSEVDHQTGELIVHHPARFSGGPVSESALRKMQPVGTIIRDYFPDALRAVAAVSWVGNEKHNPGQHLHWNRGKSDDHVDCDARHFIDAAKGDGWDTTELPDGRVYAVRHAAQHAWRALAQLQIEIEKAGGEVIRVVNAGITLQSGETSLNAHGFASSKSAPETSTKR